MNQLILKNCLVNGELVDIAAKNGIISAIGKIAADGIDVGGNHVFAGLVDIHTHGMIGHDTMDGDKLPEMSRFLLTQGVTSWLPTTMTVSFDQLSAITNMKLPHCDANILGFHAEGPYISKKYKGAQNERHIEEPNIEQFSRLNNITMVTIAPELPKAREFIKKCNAVVSLGHTACTYDEAVLALSSGATCLTHTFNAMPPLHHREPSAIGAALDCDAYVQVICDGLHIHPAVIRMLYRLFGKERMILISDSMRATGLADGKYEFGGQYVTVTNGVARTEDGAIAGSTSTLLDCVKKAIEFGIPRDDALIMASKTPCELLKLNKGQIREGFDADFMITDNDLHVKACVVGGTYIPIKKI